MLFCYAYYFPQLETECSSKCHTEPGNDSMAANIDDDAEGLVCEAVGHNILSIYLMSRYCKNKFYL